VATVRGAGMPGEEGAEARGQTQNGGQPLEHGGRRHAAGHRDEATDLRDRQVGVGRVGGRRDDPVHALRAERHRLEMAGRVYRTSETGTRERGVHLGEGRGLGHRFDHEPTPRPE